MLGVKRADAASLRRAVRAAGVHKQVSYAYRNGLFEAVFRGARVGTIEDRSGWESQLLGTLSARKVTLRLAQL